MRNLLRLLVLFRPYLHWMALGVLVSLITLLANVTLMAVSGWFIAAMAIAGASGVSMNYFSPAAIIRAMAILRTGGRYAERLITHETTFRLLAELRTWFYRHLEPLAPAVLERYRSGDLLSRIRADIDTLDNLYVRVMVPLFVAVVAVVALSLIMGLYDAKLGWMLFCLLLVAGAGLPLLSVRLARTPGATLVTESAMLRTNVVDGVQGMAELILFGAGPEQAERISESSKAVIAAQSSMSRISGLSQAGMLLCANLALLGVVLIAVPLVNSEGIEPAELAMLALFALAAFESVMPLPEAFRLMAQTLPAAERLFRIVDSKPLVAEPDVSRKEPASFDIRFEQVSFGYQNNEPAVLDGFDLHIPDGAKLAIVGPSGIGKSSLIQLLLGFREPQQGRITLGGYALGEYQGERLREWISVVPQQVHLFNATIADNLRLAKPNASEDELRAACRIAQIDEFIQQLPDGFDTWTGETGVRLSGGQARRIAIARALLRPSRLLILDEPGEGLDTATERAMMQAIVQHLHGTSLLVISHRMQGLQQMDHIVDMECR